jgi:glycosyltransferase involved in cell wall biosynthesis
MRVLLTSNACYAPPRGGSTRSNLLWLAHLVSQGHACRVVSPTLDRSVADNVDLDANGIEINSVCDLSRRTSVLAEQIRSFQPDWVLVSSEDLSHVLLREAQTAAPGRIVYIAHTPQFYPFGPASWNRDAQAAQRVRDAAGVIVISNHVRDYVEEHLGVRATVIHPPMYGKEPFPRFGSFDRGYILMINPSIVKGLTIFAALAERFPNYPFAGLAGWGTTSSDRNLLARLPNVTMLDTVPSIDDVLAQSRLLLMPSLWHEGFGLIAMEAMLRGLPVISSDAGGLKEAKNGTNFVIPVRPIEEFQPVFDEAHMPKPVEVEQDLAPWEHALRSLLTDETLYWQEAERSREVALEFVRSLRVEAFEDYLLGLQPVSAASSLNQEAHPDRKLEQLSAAKRALLLQRLRRK